MNKRVDVLNGNILKTLILLSFPILVCGLFQQLYNVVDTMIVGHFVGGLGIAIVGGSCNMLINLFFGVSVGIITGSIIVVANNFGAQNADKVRKCIETSVIVAIFSGLLIMLIYIFFARTILTFLNVPSEILSASVQYLIFYSFGFPFYFLFQMIINIFRALGETKRPTRYLISSFLLNIFFDLIFIGLFKLNENGVALAFITTQVISAAVALKSLSLQLDVKFKDIMLERSALKSIMKIGLPSSLTSLLYALTNILIQSSINILGSESIGGFAINSKIENLFWTIMTCIGFAITTFIGQNYGARNTERIKSSIKTSLYLGYGITFIISITIYTCRFLLARMFTTDTAMIDVATQIMGFMAPIYFTYTAIEILSGILKGIGKVMVPTLITLSCICVVRSTYVIFYAMHHLSILTVLKAYPISWLVTSGAFIIYFIIEKRRILDVKGNVGISRTNP